MQTVLAKYEIRIDTFTSKITCPFKFHQGGHERTPSFYLYPETNTFWCFGCKTGRAPVDFVAAYDEVSRSKAASKILRLFENDVSDDWEIVSCNTAEKQNVMFDFSKSIREVLVPSPSEIESIETITQAFDILTERYDLDIDGLKKLSSRLKERLSK